MTNQNLTPSNTDATETEDRPRNTKRNFTIGLLAAIVTLFLGTAIAAIPAPAPDAPAPPAAAKFSIPAPVNASPIGQFISASSEQADKTGLTIRTTSTNAENIPTLLVFDPTSTAATNQVLVTNQPNGLGEYSIYKKAAAIHSGFFTDSAITGYGTWNWVDEQGAGDSFAQRDDGTWASTSEYYPQVLTVGSDGFISRVVALDASGVTFTTTFTYDVDAADSARFSYPEASTETLMNGQNSTATPSA